MRMQRTRRPMAAFGAAVGLTVAVGVSGPIAWAETTDGEQAATTGECGHTTEESSVTETPAEPCEEPTDSSGTTDPSDTEPAAATPAPEPTPEPTTPASEPTPDPETTTPAPEPSPARAPTPSPTATEEPEPAPVPDDSTPEPGTAPAPTSSGDPDTVATPSSSGQQPTPGEATKASADAAGSVPVAPQLPERSSSALVSSDPAVLRMHDIPAVTGLSAQAGPLAFPIVEVAPGGIALAVNLSQDAPEFGLLGAAQRNALVRSAMSSPGRADVLPTDPSSDVGWLEVFAVSLLAGISALLARTCRPRAWRKS